MREQRVFQVGGHRFMLAFRNGMLSEKELKSYTPFQTDSYYGNDHRSGLGEEMIFTLTFIQDKEALSYPNPSIADFENENGRTTIYSLDDGSMAFYLYTVDNKECCRLHISKDFRIAEAWIEGTASERCYALDSALMLLYAFASSHRETVLIHASAVECEGKGYLFLGKSGTGKSTHSSLWLKHIAGSELLNDDNPILRITDGKVYVYGSPWSGKTACYRNRKIPVGGIVRLHQAPFNKITPLTGVRAYAALKPSCSLLAWDKEMAEDVHQTLSRIIEITPVSRLECLPNREAALICKNAMTKML